MPNRIHKTDWTLRISLILLSIIAVLAYINTDDLVKQNKNINHTYEIITALESAQSMLSDAERGQRGYLLTGKDYYLSPYDEAMLKIGPTLDYISFLTKDNNDQQKNIYLLRVEINKKMSELKDTVNLRKQDKLDEAMTIVQTDAGRTYMVHIQDLIYKMKDIEHNLLAFRMSVSSNLAYRCLWLFPVLIILAIFLTNYSLWLIRNERVEFANQKKELP